MSDTGQVPGVSEPTDVPDIRVRGAASARFAISSGQLWMLLAILLPAIASLLAPVASGDVATQVPPLESGTSIDADPFAFAVQGERWINQQWVASTALGDGFELSGWAVLLLLRAVLIGLTFGLVYAACRGSGASSIVSSLVALGAFVVSATNLGLRPEMIGLLLFAAVMAILVYRHKHPLLLWLIPVLMLAWANTHGSFLIGWAAIAVAALEDIAARSRLAIATIVVGVLSVLLTLMNPWGVEMWGYVRDLATNPLITQLTAEWQPTTLISPAGLFFFSSVALVLLLLLVRGRSISWLQVAWLVTLALVGVMAPQGVAWWAIGAAPIVAVLVGGLTILGRPLSHHGSEQKRTLGYTAMAGLLVLFALIALPIWRPIDALYSMAEGSMNGVVSPHGDDFGVITMRGGWPGDSRESLEASLADGVRFVEVDFVETADGHIVTGHEPQLGGECGDVSQRTMSQLRGCRLGTGEHLATLADFLALPFEGVWVDLKSDAIPAAVAEIVRAGRMTDVVLMAYDAKPADLDLMREAGVRGGLKGYPETPDAIRRMIDRTAALGLEVEVSEARWITPDLVAYAQEQGVDVLPWVAIGAPDDRIRELVNAGVTGLIVSPLANLYSIIRDE